MNAAYTIHQFLPADVERFRAMRLEALQLEPGMFGNSYELEATFTAEQRLQRVSKPDSTCFGLYAGDLLIGITGIMITDKEKNLEVYMTRSYIREAHRDKKLSRLLYEALFY